MSAFNEAVKALLKAKTFEKVLLEHIPDRKGKCRKCFKSELPQPFPCFMFKVATEAQAQAIHNSTIKEKLPRGVKWRKEYV